MIFVKIAQTFVNSWCIKRCACICYSRYYDISMPV